MNDLHLVYNILGYVEGRIDSLKHFTEYGTSKEIEELKKVKEHIERLIGNK